MSFVRRWPSLADQLALATRLYGHHGEPMVADWLDHQESLIDNTDFAREFADHIELPGISPLDYCHRHLRTHRGELVAGIRFYNRNIDRPFIEVLAHTFNDIDALADCVSAEWSIFSAPFMRLRTQPGRITGHNTFLDQSIHVARYHQMPAPDGRVQLEIFTIVDDAIALVADRYDHLAQDQPELADNLSPAAADDLRRWHAHRQLRAVRTHNSTVGVLAVAPGSIGWITGDEINEEVISTPHSGHGYAASAQTTWAAHIATDPEQFLIGTIDRHNHASRRTALAVGRPPVLADTFVALDSPPDPAARR
ncbi:MAG: hypothetical protein AB7G47_09815 [Mycolicibacterium sp.]|uniref:hypothetical protein n=1 Tax=Mycolicibacterium sp. TaxID=2320850 RepID=UPI003D102C01